ncbi:MAG: hypothetical protein JWQ07_94 [Ramlibacter sp.]|nr:hypothetical protein [Ramlibacter sp.]
MELLLMRDQQSGMLGGTKFQLTAKAKLTDAESSAVKKYKMGETILYEKPTDKPDPNSFMSLARHRFTVPRIQVRDLVDGKTIETKDILEILDAEEQLTDAAKAFHKMLRAASTFGGETALTFADE